MRREVVGHVRRDPKPRARVAMEIPTQEQRWIAHKDDASVGAFLGSANRERVHRLIIQQVYTETDGRIKIGPQSDEELQIVMIRTMQGNHDRRLPVAELNRLVVQQCTRTILGNVSSYMRFSRDMRTQGAGADAAGGADALGADDFVRVLRPTTSRDSRERQGRPVF